MHESICDMYIQVSLIFLWNDGIYGDAVLTMFPATYQYTQQVCPLVSKLKSFYDYSSEVEAVLPELLHGKCVRSRSSDEEKCTHDSRIIFLNMWLNPTLYQEIKDKKRILFFFY